MDVAKVWPIVRDIVSNGDLRTLTKKIIRTKVQELCNLPSNLDKATKKALNSLIYEAVRLGDSSSQPIDLTEETNAKQQHSYRSPTPETVRLEKSKPVDLTERTSPSADQPPPLEAGSPERKREDVNRGSPLGKAEQSSSSAPIDSRRHNEKRAAHVPQNQDAETRLSKLRVDLSLAVARQDFLLAHRIKEKMEGLSNSSSVSASEVEKSDAELALKLHKEECARLQPPAELPSHLAEEEDLQLAKRLQTEEYSMEEGSGRRRKELPIDPRSILDPEKAAEASRAALMSAGPARMESERRSIRTSNSMWADDVERELETKSCYYHLISSDPTCALCKRSIDRFTKAGGALPSPRVKRRRLTAEEKVIRRQMQDLDASMAKIDETLGHLGKTKKPSLLSPDRLTRRKEKRKSGECPGVSMSNALRLHEASSSSSSKSVRNRSVSSVPIRLVEENDESKDRKELLAAASKEVRRRPLWKNALMDKSSGCGRTQKATARGKRGRAAIAAVIEAKR
mmetsp:Transcript_17083/g.32469  ORF Transcript_17083/g.32469 Transcript_17083/m.32469 type:complete len:512 (-) Transcript_17083:113-1648(-)